MMTLTKRVNLRAIFLIVVAAMLTSCMNFSANEIYGIDPVNSSIAGKNSDSESLLHWLKFRPEKISARAKLEISDGMTGDHERNRLAQGFGLEKAQAMDVGVYGKLGKSTVFVAHRKHIPDYDRLYWVMIRVLSEKYGCFIKKKFPYENQIGFECRDRRTIVMQRDISGEYAKFVGWQFDPAGKEVVITKEAKLKQARFNRAQLRARRP